MFSIDLYMIKILIIGIPVVTILQPSYTTNYGDPVTLECTVTSNPLHTIVTWQKIVNGQPSSLNLGNSGKYSGSTVNTPSLTISSTNLGDPGVYRCLATNVVGTGQSQDTTLTVNGGQSTDNFEEFFFNFV